MIFKIIKIKRSDSSRLFNPLGVMVLLTDSESEFKNADEFFRQSYVHKRTKRDTRMVFNKLASDLSNEGAVVQLPLIKHYNGEISTRWEHDYNDKQIGFVVAYKNDILNFLKKKKISKKVNDAIKELLEIEVKNYSYYLNGEVYKVEIFDEDGEIIDSNIVFGYANAMNFARGFLK